MTPAPVAVTGQAQFHGRPPALFHEDRRQGLAYRRQEHLAQFGQSPRPSTITPR